MAMERYYKTGQQVRVTIPAWLQYRQNTFSRVMDGELLHVTDRAVQFRGRAAVLESQYCLRCGREINNPASIKIGYGPDCAEKIHAYHEGRLDLSEADAIRKAIMTMGLITMWLPANHVEIEVLQEAPPIHAPASAAERSAMAQETRRSDTRISIEDGRIIVRSSFRHKDRCKDVPGARWDAKRKAWTYPLSPTSAASLAGAFHGFGMEVSSDFGALLQEAEKAQAALEHKTDDDLPPVPVSNTDAWMHQRQAFWFAKPQRAAMLAMDMGTGKSKVVVDLIVNRGHKRILIVAPRSVVNVWPNQFKVHGGAPVTVEPLLQGSVAVRAERAQKALNLAAVRKENLALVINYESVWREAFAKFALGVDWDLTVLDESHRIKSPGGKASMFLSRLAAKSAYRLALTGTPMPHNPLDIYAQYRFLDPGVFGTSFVRFRNRYAIMGGYGNHSVVDYQRQDEMNEKFYSLAYRVTKDVLDLPEAIHMTRTCALEPKSKRLYGQLERDFWAEVESGEVTVANALTKLLRLQQVACGFIRDDEGNTVDVGTEKSDLLADVLEDIPTNEPVVVFARFVRDLERIKQVVEAQGRRYGELSGRRNDLTEDSEMPDNVDVMAVQIQSGGVGINLTRACYCIYYSLGFSLGDYEQSLARVHRPGQDRTVRYIHLLAESTVDQRVYQALEQRKAVVKEILEWGGDA